MKTFLTVNQTAERFPAFTRAGLRHLIFNASTNGFDTCLRRIGRKVLICEEEFYEYVNNARPSKSDKDEYRKLQEDEYSKLSEEEKNEMTHDMGLVYERNRNSF